MRKYQSISEIEQADDKAPVYVLNTAADTPVGSSGELFIGIPKLSGTRVDNLSIPQTWLPVAVTDQIPKQQLLASSEFRNAVNSGLITLITQEYADAILVQDGADEEKERLAAYKRAVADALKASRLTDEAVSEMDKETAQFEQSFLIFCDNLATKNDTEALNAIRTRAKFSKSEVQHIIKHHLVDKEKTKSFLMAQLGSGDTPKAAETTSEA